MNDSKLRRRMVARVKEFETCVLRNENARGNLHSAKAKVLDKGCME